MSSIFRLPRGKRINGEERLLGRLFGVLSLSLFFVFLEILKTDCFLLFVFIPSPNSLKEVPVEWCFSFEQTFYAFAFRHA